MATIIILEPFDLDYDEVLFYTIRYEEKDDSETDLFIVKFKIKEDDRFEDGFEEEIDDILSWIDAIGKRGMKICHLRHENAASALPPKRSFLDKKNESKTIENNSLIPLPIGANKLRLYCVKLGERTLVLCGGGKKESQTVQESPDVIQHYRLANKVAKALEKMITSREIQINRETGQILDMEDGIEIWIS